MRRTNGEGYIEQRKKADWDKYMNDGDEIVFFEPKKKRRNQYDRSVNMTEEVGMFKSNGKNPKSASFKSGVKGAINNERAI